MTVYFVCDRIRQGIDKKYALEFYNDIKNGKSKVKLHNIVSDARIELSKGFYDDSDYVVVRAIEKDGETEIRILR
jgi:hypothetical protein